MTQDDRPKVGQATVRSMGKGRSPVNEGPAHINPHHAYASQLESLKWQNSPGVNKQDGFIVAPGAPARANVANADSRQKGWHSHMGTSKQGHGFAGRRK